MTHADFYAWFYRESTKLHAAWSDAVGTPGYVKADWMSRSNALDREARDLATSIGIPRDEPLVRSP